MLRLETSDNQIVEVEQYVLRHSPTIANFIKNNGGKIPEIINLPIDSPTLRAIIEYYEHFRDDESFSDEPPPELSEFEKQFFERAYSNSLLHNLVTKSYEFGLMKLMNAACKHVANMAKGKNPEEMRQFFEISPDSDDEEDDMGGFFGPRSGQNGGSFREVQ